MNLKAMRVALCRSKLMLAQRDMEKAMRKLERAQWEAEYVVRRINILETDLAMAIEAATEGETT